MNQNKEKPVAKPVPVELTDEQITQAIEAGRVKDPNVTQTAEEYLRAVAPYLQAQGEPTAEDVRRLVEAARLVQSGYEPGTWPSLDEALAPWRTR
jgi:cytochrome c1